MEHKLKELIDNWRTWRMTLRNCNNPKEVAILEHCIARLNFIRESVLRARACPYCKGVPVVSPQYILSDKPAWDMGCENPDCKVRPRLTEQRDKERMLRIWNADL